MMAQVSVRDEARRRRRRRLTPFFFLAGHDASSSGLGDVAESIPWEQREQETVLFFDYAQRKAEEVAPRPLTFMDLAAIEDSTRGVAAAACEYEGARCLL